MDEITEQEVVDHLNALRAKDQFLTALNIMYVNHHSRGLRNRKAILLTTTNYKGVNCNAEGY